MRRVRAAFYPKIGLRWHMLGFFGHLSPCIFCRYGQWAHIFWASSRDHLPPCVFQELTFYLTRDKIIRWLNSNLMNGNSCKFSLTHTIAGRESLVNCLISFRWEKAPLRLTDFSRVPQWLETLGWQAGFQLRKATLLPTWEDKATASEGTTKQPSHLEEESRVLTSQTLVRATNP